MVIVLNMLIACMSNTFVRVTENVQMEWTFGRTEVINNNYYLILFLYKKKKLFIYSYIFSKVYVDFMTQTVLPPPFNLIPTPGGLHTVAEYLKVLCKPPPDKRARWSIKHCFYIVGIERQTTFNKKIVFFYLILNN